MPISSLWGMELFFHDEISSLITLCASYTDGVIRIWDARIESVVISFNGHKSAVTVLAFDRSGARLASGARDTDIIIWDLVAEIGLFKLRGHKDQIVSLVWIPLDAAVNQDDGQNVADADLILSASKDALVKMWDVSSQHCVETHLAQTNGECWAMAVSPDFSTCITAGQDGEMRVWSVNIEGLRKSRQSLSSGASENYLENRGVLQRHGRDRPLGLTFHPTSDYFAVHGGEKAIEVWRIRSQEEVQKSLMRKRRRKREKVAKSEDGTKNDVGAVEEGTIEPVLSDFFAPQVIVRTGGKVRAIDWIDSRPGKSIHILAALSSNQIEVYDISTHERGKKASEGSPDYTRSFSVDLPGHRADVRALALSSDDRMLASASNGSLKIWNIRTGSCLRTLDCGYALCCSFLPGDKIVVVGTKSGELELFDIASSSLIEKLQAHEGAIWTLQVHPDGRSAATGGADKTAKFWDFQIIREEIEGSAESRPRLKLRQARILKVADDVLSLCYSPDARLLAVSLLDNTVKVFFHDSLKLFLNLYGHKLPVLDMSISSDSKMIATCSADKNVRLWGLDFGDCHKAFFAHSDSVMQVSFVPTPRSIEETHYFFSAGKDKLLKNWDGDKFEQIQKLDGHHGELRAMVVSKSGDFVITASHDKSIRKWVDTEEPIFLEEERERELEELYESTLTTSLEADGDAEDGDQTAEAAAASKQTIQTLTAGERIMEALDIGLDDLKIMGEWATAKASNPKAAAPSRDPLYTALGGISAERHVLNVMSKIPAAQLHDALLVLPFSALPSLFTFANIWIQRQWDVTLVCRVLFFMLKTHQRQIVASKELKAVLEGMRGDLRRMLSEVRDLMGYNVAALRFVESAVKERKVKTIEDAQGVNPAALFGDRKRAFADVA